MKLEVKGDINTFYVQTLCMLFFPGEKFGENEKLNEDTPVMKIKAKDKGDSFYAFAELTYKGKHSECARTIEYKEGQTKIRTAKIAVGNAVLFVGSEILGYRPSWGMLTGVRPSKVAMQYLLNGNSKTKVKKILTSEYFVIPKKATLAIDIAQNEEKIIKTPDFKDCSVYISIPFCPTRCAYCSFVSYTTKKLLSLIPDYVEILLKEINDIFRTIKDLGLNLKTIYIGGGTPTTLDGNLLYKLLSHIASLTDVTKLEEYTLEAGRPDTIDTEKLSIAKEFGVSRISVNPQTLNEFVMESIGRCHTVDDFYKAYEIAKKSGIKTINTDLIAGLPMDNFRYFSETFDKILNLNPENITVHTFCVKNSSDIKATGKGIYSIKGGDVGKCVDYSQIQAMDKGYIPYYMYRQKNAVGNLENVGFAKPGTEGLYNIYMMEEVHSILSAGAGAVTKLVEYKPANEGETKIDRYFNHKYPFEYLNDENYKEKINQIYKFFENE